MDNTTISWEIDEGKDETLESLKKTGNIIRLVVGIIFVSAFGIFSILRVVENSSPTLKILMAAGIILFIFLTLLGTYLELQKRPHTKVNKYKLNPKGIEINDNFTPWKSYKSYFDWNKFIEREKPSVLPDFLSGSAQYIVELKPKPNTKISKLRITIPDVSTYTKVINLLTQFLPEREY